MFGRRKKNRADEDQVGAAEQIDREAEAAWPAAERSGTDDIEQDDDYHWDHTQGPYDFDDLEEGTDPTVGVSGARLDLGSVLVPVPPDGQLQVEMAPDGTPQAVHLVTPHGRITIAAYAAPKSPGQWREVIADLADSLRGDNATVSIETGPWGRELIGNTPNADLRFIGVDGYRWMVRCVVVGPSGAAAADSPLVETARTLLRDTVVKRGAEPHPVRTPLPVVLPQAVAEQLAAVAQQQLAAQQQHAAQEQAAQQQATQQQADTQQRRGEAGSAMQQLGR